MVVFGSWLSGPLSHLLVVSTNSTGRGFLCRAGSEGFSLGMAGWIVVGGFGLRGPRLAESPLYLGPWDEHMCAFAPIETINNRDLNKIKGHSSYHEPSLLHLRRLKSQHQGNHRAIPPPPPLLPLDGFCLGERCYNPSSHSGVYPLLHGVLVPVHR